MKVTGYTDSTHVSAAVLDALGGTGGSSFWSEGQWSPRRGYPSAVALHEGRLWWFGKTKANGSESDAYESFDDLVVGDAGPISRSIGQGPVDSINWALGLTRLLFGTEGAELSARSSSFDEPLTPTNFNIKPSTNQGSEPIAAIKVDGRAVYVQLGGQKLFELNFDVNANDYQGEDLSQIVPDLNELDPETGIDKRIVRVGVQRKPDTRFHCIRADGTAAIVVRDKVENVTCWIEYETDGAVEEVLVLPGRVEDRVYYQVARTAGGGQKRFWEKWSLESECRGGQLNKQADCFVIYDGSATTSIPCAHLEGRDVVVWADGKDFSPLDDSGNPTTFTVTGGHITLPTPVSKAVVGLFYRARFESSDRAFASALGTVVNQRKNIDAVGFVMLNTHNRGLRYGPDFDNLDALPLVEDEELVDPNYVWKKYNKDMTSFAGTWLTDARICLEAAAPRPCTISGVSVSITGHDRG